MNCINFSLDQATSSVVVSSIVIHNYLHTLNNRTKLSHNYHGQSPRHVVANSSYQAEDTGWRENVCNIELGEQLKFETKIKRSSIILPISNWKHEIWFATHCVYKKFTSHSLECFKLSSKNCKYCVAYCCLNTAFCP